MHSLINHLAELCMLVACIAFLVAVAWGTLYMLGGIWILLVDGWNYVRRRRL